MCCVNASTFPGYTVNSEYWISRSSKSLLFFAELTALDVLLIFARIFSKKFSFRTPSTESKVSPNSFVDSFVDSFVLLLVVLMIFLAVFLPIINLSLLSIANDARPLNKKEITITKCTKYRRFNM